MNDRKQHILVVEDEQHLAFGIKFNLEAEDFKVSVADDGREALKLLSEKPDAFDLVILDVMLPGMNGYTVCEQLREQGYTVPILILSARTLTEDKTRGFDAGANQYLVKPFELDELLSRVKNLLALGDGHFNAPLPTVGASTKGPTTERFEFGDCSIDFQTYKVIVRGEPVKLTALQMKLLRYFCENEGRVIPRAELLEKVWNMPGNMHTRAPDQFISSLRKVFEPEPTRPVHFLTIRDAGYRFIAEPEMEPES